MGCAKGPSAARELVNREQTFIHVDWTVATFQVFSIFYSKALRNFYFSFLTKVICTLELITYGTKYCCPLYSSKASPYLNISEGISCYLHVHSEVAFLFLSLTSAALDCLLQQKVLQPDSMCKVCSKTENELHASW